MTLGQDQENVAEFTLYHMNYMHLQSLSLLRPTVKGEMYLQENTLFFTFDLGVNVTQNVAQNPMHHLRSLKLLRPTLLEEMQL